MLWSETASRFRRKTRANIVTPSSVARWQADPREFVADCLRAPNGDPIIVWEKMGHLLSSLVANKRVACRAGRKVSKTYGASIVALWWAMTRPRGRVIITGPTYRTVQTELWRDLREIHRSAIIELPRCSPMAETGIQWADGREIRGFSADKPEAAASTSGAELLYIVDEASGMSPAILETIMGNLAGGGSLMLISNPTRQEGFFYEVFAQPDRHQIWHKLHISSEDSPNVQEGRIVIPGLATREWVDEMLEKWGRDSTLYRVHALGEFPGQGDDAINGLDLLLEAIERFVEPSAPGPAEVQIGVDVARFGDDDSVVCVRVGDRILPFDHGDVNGVVHGQRTTDVAGLALYLARKYAPLSPEPPVVVVDDTGVGGGVTDQLVDCDDIEVVAVNAACVANDEEHYEDLRTELWFEGREFLRSGGKLPADAYLQADLASCHYRMPRGRFRAESKPEIKKRLGRSPDRADAYNLACYTGGASVTDEQPRLPQQALSRYAGAGRGIG